MCLCIHVGEHEKSGIEGNLLTHELSHELWWLRIVPYWFPLGSSFFSMFADHDACLLCLRAPCARALRATSQYNRSDIRSFFDRILGDRRGTSGPLYPQKLPVKNPLGLAWQTLTTSHFAGAPPRRCRNDVIKWCHMGSFRYIIRSRQKEKSNFADPDPQTLPKIRSKKVLVTVP